MNITDRKKTEYRDIKQLAKLLRERGQVSLLAVILLYKLLTVVCFLPLLHGIWALALMFSPVSYITSGNMQNLFQSPLISIAVIVMAVLAAAWNLYEFSLIINGLDFGFKGQRYSIRELFWRSFCEIKHVFLPKNLPMLFVAALLIPFTNLFLTSSFISQLAVPEYIMEVIRDDNLYFFLYGLIVAGGCLLSFLWIFAFHFFILEKNSFRKAAGNSLKMVKEHFLTVLTGLLRYNIGLFALYTVLITFLIILGIILILWMGVNYPDLTRALSMAFTYVEGPFIAYIIECSLTIAQFALIAAFYYHFKDLKEEKAEKKLKVGSSLLLYLSIAGTGVVTAFLCTGLLLIPDLVPEVQPPTVTCHRGYSAVAPENTLPAFQAAIDAGADCAELDVQMTSDGVVVVTHDTNLKRCTGADVNVYDISYDELRKLDAGSWFSAEYAGTRLPTLEEVIELCKGKIRLNIEIKQNGHSPELEAETARIITELGFTDQCTVTSLNYESLSKVKEAAPEIETGYILALGAGSYYDLPDADFFSVETTFVTSGMVSAIHLRGKKISVWTVDREADADKMIDLGVDDLITGKPDMVKEAIANSKDIGSVILDEIDLLKNEGEAVLSPE